MPAASPRTGLIALCLLSIVAGALTGLLCGAFRLALEAAARFRASLPETLAAAGVASPVTGCLIIVALAALATATAAFMVRRISPAATGSGIPHVEAVLDVEMPPAPFSLLPVKFIGGVLAMGSGLALGREGPCVQMGGTLAHIIGQIFRREWPDRQALMAAGAGAGLAAAFNAPFAGAVFVLEELLKRFEMRNAVAALGASMSAIVVARFLTGAEPDFLPAALPVPDARDNLLCLGLGVVAGVLATLYNFLLFDALAIADGMKRLPVEARAGLVGAAFGALAWFAPELVGGGDGITQSILSGSTYYALLPLLFCVRLCMSSASYAAGTPGGLFAPLLVLGAQIGFFFGALTHAGAADPNAHAILFAIVGMAALFAGVVRAPLTGMILVTEMTGGGVALLPMLAACFAAMATAIMLGGAPVYDGLKERTLRLAAEKPESADEPATATGEKA